LHLNKNQSILDAGCGRGQLIADLYNTGFKHVYGFDISESGISIAKQSFPYLRNNYFVHNAYDRNLPHSMPQQYDVIISMEVIEHLFSPRAYLCNIKNWLSPNGYLILTTPYHGFLKNLATIVLHRFDRHYDPLSEGGHIKFFSQKTIAALLHQSGFKVLEFYGAGRIPFFWKSMIILAQNSV